MLQLLDGLSGESRQKTHILQANADFAPIIEPTRVYLCQRLNIGWAA